jgi:hypothetical protein
MTQLREDREPEEAEAQVGTKGVHSFGPNGATRLFAEWDDIFGYRTATNVLEKWKQEFLDEEMYLIRECSTSNEAILRSFVHEVMPFDCLAIGGWKPNENRLSDVVASLFSTNWNHPFAVPILRCVFNALISDAADLSPGRRNSIERLRSSFDRSPLQIFVWRERPGALSRADIEIFVSGKEPMLITIEHKVRDGEETLIDGVQQTIRLWDDAVARAEQLGVPADRVIGIFLTPGGDLPTNDKFVPMSFQAFAEAVCAGVKGHPDKHISEAAMSILGFMNFYRRA